MLLFRAIIAGFADCGVRLAGVAGSEGESIDDLAEKGIFGIESWASPDELFDLLIGGESGRKVCSDLPELKISV
jgi:hypothetical protein